MQDLITLRDRLMDIVIDSRQEQVYSDLVILIIDLERQIKAYDDYMDQMAHEQEAYEDRVAVSA
jgi:predicted phosphoadenosine phosphosulfate sulfurtransferase